MSDLFCAARLLCLPASRLTDGRSVDLRRALAAERLAAVYAPDPAAAEGAGALAAPVTVQPLLAAAGHVGAGGVGGPIRAVLEEIADVHRGETVLVVVPAAVAGGAVLVERDADGWACREWPGPRTVRP